MNWILKDADPGLPEVADARERVAGLKNVDLWKFSEKGVYDGFYTDKYFALRI